jgi:hypothetical protein
MRGVSVGVGLGVVVEPSVVGGTAVEDGEPVAAGVGERKVKMGVAVAGCGVGVDVAGRGVRVGRGVVVGVAVGGGEVAVGGSDVAVGRGEEPPGLETGGVSVGEGVGVGVAVGGSGRVAEMGPNTSMKPVTSSASSR